MRIHILMAAALAVTACTAATPRQVAPAPAPAPILQSDVDAFYAAYEAALKAHRGDTLAHFYHPRGATIIFDGARAQVTHAGLDSSYRTRWRGPAFFAFDSLRTQQIGPSQVLVTGGFRWLRAASPDTGRLIYLSIVERTPVGLRILVEHETRRP